jgi:antitoxin component YwqK of YwqJK toxin-antitoxin module
LAAACGGDKQKPKADPLVTDDAGSSGDPVIDARKVTAPTFDAMPVPAAATNTIPDQWWKDAATHCPDGTKLAGAPPPDGNSVSCVDGNYQDTGPYTYFHSNGSKYMVGMKKRGQYDGLWVYFHDNGQKRLENSFVDGKLHGPRLEWHENGAPSLTGGYIEGKPHGSHRSWDPSGKELGAYFVDHGTGDTASWYDSGTKASEGALRDGQQDGPWVYFHENGQKRETTTYAAGKQTGLATSWNDKGAKVAEGSYTDGRWSGDWTYWDASGAIKRVDTYGDDGQKTVQRDYQDGEPLGLEPGPPGACATDLGVVQTWDKAKGREISTSDKNACVWRAWGFPGVTVLGGFAHDRGCKPMGTFIDCELGEWSSTEILARAGWKKAKQPARETIAMRYLRQIHTKYSNSVIQDPDKPVIKSGKDGSVTITAWTARPSGMRRGRTIDKRRYTFSASGEVTVKNLETKEER